jgi:hypothetical protein
MVMKAQVKNYVTAGIAIVGASAIAVTPISAVPPNQMVRATDVESVNLLAQPTPSELLAGCLDTFGDFLPGGALEDAADGAGDVVDDFRAAFGQASAVMGGATRGAMTRA